MAGSTHLKTVFVIDGDASARDSFSLLLSGHGCAIAAFDRALANV